VRHRCVPGYSSSPGEAGHDGHAVIALVIVKSFAAVSTMSGRTVLNTAVVPTNDAAATTAPTTRVRPIALARRNFFTSFAPSKLQVWE
jgi:hypothetical protein